MEASEARERSSALGHLMVGAELGGHLIPLGKTDQNRLDECLKAKEKGKMTPAMERDLPMLIEKRDTPFQPKLSEGAKTRVSDKWYGEKFDYQKRFITKATRKGHLKEREAIRDVAELLGYSFSLKNEKHFEDSFTHGTPDWILRKFIFDIKCVWEPKGLDFFSDKLKGIYEWQVKDYCRHTGKSHGAIARVLMNPPDHMILGLAKPLWEEAGYHWTEPITDEFLEAVRDEYDFERKNPLEDRIKIIRVDFTEHDDKLIKQQICLMREEWQRLDDLFVNKNKDEIDFFRFNSSSN